MRRITLLVAAAIKATLIFAYSAQADQSDCSASLDTMIDENSPNTITSTASFAKTDGKQVPFTALSAANIMVERARTTTSLRYIDVCIKYQLRNNSDNDDIHSLYWPVAGVYNYDYLIKPHQASMIFPNPYTEASNIFSGIEKVSAFRGIQADARVLRPLYNSTAMPNSEERSPLGRSPMPVPEQVAPSGFELDPVENFGLKTPADMSEVIPTIRYSSTTPDGVEITYISGVQYRDGLLDFYYELSAGKASAISAPFLFAMRELHPSPSISSTKNFIESLSSFRKALHPDDIQSKFSFEINPRISEFHQVSVFYTEHPVTIKTAGGKACFNLPIFSPIPVRLNEQYCSE